MAKKMEEGNLNQSSITDPSSRSANTGQNLWTNTTLFATEDASASRSSARWIWSGRSESPFGLL